VNTARPREREGVRSTGRRRRLAAAILALAALMTVSCGSDPQTPEERRRVGDDWLRKMDDRLGHATGVSVSIRGTRQRVQDGQATTVPFTLEIVLRGAGGVHARQTVNGAAPEAWYDGKTLTLLSEADRTTEDVPLAADQDAALARIGEDFGLDPALTTLFSNAPYWNELADESVGGWRGRQTVGGVVCEQIAYASADQDIDLWIASSGDPLPQRVVVGSRETGVQTTSDVSFSNWNLAPGTADEMFRPTVPDGYTKRAPGGP
jgi:hypothetical protein